MQIAIKDDTAASLDDEDKGVTEMVTPQIAIKDNTAASLAVM